LPGSPSFPIIEVSTEKARRLRGKEISGAETSFIGDLRSCNRQSPKLGVGAKVKIEDRSKVAKTAALKPRGALEGTQKSGALQASVVIQGIREK